MRSKATASKVAAATPAATAKAICMTVASPTASGYAEQDERECHADGGGGECPQCPLRFGREGLSGDRDRRAVDQLDAARHLSCATANDAHGGGQASLRMTEEGGERGGEHGLDANGLGSGEVGGEDWEGAPGQREPRVAVKAPAEELEVVGHGDERPCRDERKQPEAGAERHNDPDDARACERGDGERDERRLADARLERTSVQLVESVRRDAHAEEEREQTEAEHRVLEVRSQRGADCNVREVPQGVRRVKQRHVVAPPARRECIEGGTGGAGHARRPQVTIPPPRLSRRDVTPPIPAPCQSWSRCSSGQRA